MIKTLEESRAFFAADRFAMEACGISIDEVTQDGARCSMPLTRCTSTPGEHAI